MNLKDKILRQKKLDYVKGEIANYEMAVKHGKDWATQFNVKKLEEFTAKLLAL